MSLLLLGGGQPQNAAPASSFKITVMQTSNSAVIYENDNIDTVMTYLNSYTASVPITVQFNDNTIHQPASGSISITTGLNNGTNVVTFRSKPGFTATVDGQLLSNTVVTINNSYITWDGINVINALTSDSDTGGTIVRLSSNRTNLTVKNCLIKRGFVGIRGTTKITNITIENVVFEEINYGCIRIGGGSFTPSTKWEDFDARISADYDLYNVIVRNITALDTLAGGNVPGTTQPFSPLILVKQTEGVTIERVSATGTGSVVAVEGSKTVLINRILAPACTQYGINVLASDVVTISNSFVKPVTGAGSTYIYLDIIRDLKLVHNTFIYSNSSDSIQITKARRVLKVVGNLFVNGYNAGLAISFAADINGTAYTRSLAQDFQEEHDNVFVSEEGGFDHILALYGIAGGSDILVRKSNTWSGSILDTTYRTNYPGYGVNSKFEDTDIITLVTRTNPDSSTSGAFYLGAADSTTTGRNMISGPVSTEGAYDNAGFVRSYPTDAGSHDRDATSTATVVNNLNISPSTLTATSLGASYSQTFTTTGGNGSYTYNVVEGPLPTGLSLATSTGILSGTVGGSAGTYIFSIGVRDTAGSIGMRSFSLVISSATVPAAPTGLSATPGNSSATISFTAGSDGGSAITNYQYSINAGSSWTALSPVDTTSPVTITGLTNGTTYNILLRAVNAIGNGAASASVTVTPVVLDYYVTINGSNQALVNATLYKPGGGGFAASFATWVDVYRSDSGGPLTYMTGGNVNFAAGATTATPLNATLAAGGLPHVAGRDYYIQNQIMQSNPFEGVTLVYQNPDITDF